MKRAKTYYPVRVKKKVVQMVSAGLLSEQQACQKFKISLKLLHEWQCWYDEYFIQPHQNSNTMPKKKLSDKERIKQLEAQLKESQQQLKHEKLKSETLDTMIDIAEEELEVKIRKKSGAKQSNK